MPETHPAELPIPRVSALLTDLYQLTMLSVYFRKRMRDVAVFEFFVRRLPAQRNFLIACGLEQVLQYLESLRFTPMELEWLAGCGHFQSDCIDQLAALRFTGDVHAMPEGTLFFADEPVLRVTAALPEAQLVESRLINLLQFQSMIASKAARCVLAAPEKMLVDFGMRRAHGAEAALLAARAAYVAGFTGTATVQAGQYFGIPCFGTMAHSFVQAHDAEQEAFENFARNRPGNVVLLIDTYDTRRGARRAVALADKLASEGIRVAAVRIDSGKLADEARAVREILDQNGGRHIRIFASGNLDEQRMADMLAQGAPVDGFGIGTRLDASTDAPSLDCAYKLQEYAGQARRKRSPGKQTWPGRKQVYRKLDGAGTLLQDTLGLEGEEELGTPLLRQVMGQGKRLARPESLAEIRERTTASLRCLPPSLARLEPAPAFTVQVSESLRGLTRQVDSHFD